MQQRLEDWRRVHAVNAEGVFLGCRAAIPAIRASGGGSIVNVASRAAIRAAPPHLAAYGASKGAVHEYTMTVAIYCARAGYNIRCNSDLAAKKPMVGKIAEMYKQKYNIAMGENTARSFTAPFVLADAFNRAKTTEAEAVVKALLETNIPGDMILNPWKGVQFDPQTHQNIHSAMLVQIQDQAYYTVWPFDAASRDVVWPFPAWKGRK